VSGPESRYPLVTCDLRHAEISLPPPSGVRKAVAAALSDPVRQAPMAGLPELRDGLASHLSHQGLPAEAGRIVVTTGASGAIAALVLACTSEGAGVLIPDPGFPGHRLSIEALGRRAIRYPMPGREHGLALAQDLGRTALDAEAMVWLAPHNPTGEVTSTVLAAAIAKVARDRKLFLISDEVNSDLCWDRAQPSLLLYSDLEHSAGVWSASKSMRLPGARVGWVLTSATIARKVAQAAWALTMSAPLPGQLACLACLGDYANIVDESRQYVRKNLTELTYWLSPHFQVRLPAAGSCLWLDIRPIGLDAEDFATRLRSSTGVAVWPGEHFGPAGRGHLRISAGTERAVLVEGLKRMTAFVSDLAHLT
jgi:aspartate/methionine/tyrosine aminotransferase